jgi:hypothetical protein
MREKLAKLDAMPAESLNDGSLDAAIAELTTAELDWAIKVVQERENERLKAAQTGGDQCKK